MVQLPGIWTGWMSLLLLLLLTAARETVSWRSSKNANKMVIASANFIRRQ